MSIFPLTVKTGGQLHSKDGVWNHDQIIGKPFGHKVLCCPTRLLVYPGHVERIFISVDMNAKLLARVSPAMTLAAGVHPCGRIRG